MPQPSPPTRTTPSPLCQRTQQAGRSRLLAHRVVATASPTFTLGPAEAARLRVTWPCRLVELDDEES